MTDVFVSYQSQDREKARALAEALQKRGLDVWWDRDLVTGDNYRKVIEKEVHEAKVVIVIWSADAVASPWVLDEADVAGTKRKLLPVKFDAAFQNIPIGFGQIQVQDLSGWSGAVHSPEIAEIERKIDAIINDRFREALLNVGGSAIKGQVRPNDAVTLINNLSTSIGGMPIGRFLAGSLLLAIAVTAVIAAGELFYQGGAPLAVLGFLPVYWIIIMLVRAGHQFVILAKARSARHFFDTTFSFLLTVCLQVALIAYVVYVVFGGGFKLDELLGIVPMAALVLTIAVVAIRMAITSLVFLVRRAR